MRYSCPRKQRVRWLEWSLSWWTTMLGLVWTLPSLWTSILPGKRILKSSTAGQQQLHIPSQQLCTIDVLNEMCIEYPSIWSTDCRFHNKGVYLQLGLQKMISKGDTKDLHKHITVFADGRRVDLPDVEGVVFLNIQSWGAGADAWGTSQDPVSLRLMFIA